MQTSKRDQPKSITTKERAINFCRQESLTRLKYAKTLSWLDAGREEKAGVWLITGIREAAGPAGAVDQQYTCRVQMVADRAELKMIQIFKEASKSGKDIFEIHK